MKLLIFSGLSDKKLRSKLAPIIALEKVDKIYLIRNFPLSLPKIQSLKIGQLIKIPFLRELAKLCYGYYVALVKGVDYVIGIYLIPHGILAYIIGKLLHKPTIQLFVGNDVDFIEKHKKVFKGLLSQAVHIGLRGFQSKQRLNNILKEEHKFFIHHNVFSLPEINQITSLRTKKTIDIIYIGDFTSVKRIDIFLKIIAKLKKKFPEIRAIMVGGDKKKKFYEKMKTKLKLETNVRFTGRVMDVYSYLIKSKLFLMTSEAEGLPMAAIEAMSIGIPCILPRVGDIPDLVQDGHNALLVKPLNEEAFISKATKLLQNKELYQKISKAALETIRKKEKEFSLEYNKLLWDKILA